MTTAKMLILVFTLVSGQPDWEHYKKEMVTQYEQAEKDGIDSDMQSFLNRKLVAHCASMNAKKEQDIKKALYLLAMYHDQDCKLPEAAETVLFKYKDKLFQMTVNAIKDSVAEDEKSGKETAKEEGK